MRLVTANNFYYLRGGSERVLFDEEQILIAKGHEVFPFSTVHAENLPAPSAAHFIGDRTLGTPGAWQKIAQLPSIFHNVKAAKAFAQLLDRYQPDLVHAHNIYGTLTTAVLVEAQRRSIPSIMTAHDAKLVCPTYLCLDHGQVCERCRGKHFYRAALRGCHRNGVTASAIYALESYYNLWLKRYGLLRRIIVPSRFLRDLFIRNGVAGDRLAYVPNGVDVRSIAPDFSAGDYVLYAGRLSREKGIVTLLQAARDSKVPLRIVGDGPLRRQVQQAARDAENIHFDGYKRGPELSSIFRNASFVVLPSEWYENAPLTLLEAYAHGKPVLCARIGGISELVVPGETGRLFEPCNRNELEGLLAGMWDERGRLVELGKNARRLVEREYSLEVHGERLINIYRECVN